MKKEIKIRLTTVVIILVTVLLLIALIWGGIYYSLNKNSAKAIQNNEIDIVNATKMLEDTSYILKYNSEEWQEINNGIPNNKGLKYKEIEDLLIYCFEDMHIIEYIDISDDYGRDDLYDIYYAYLQRKFEDVIVQKGNAKFRLLKDNIYYTTYNVVRDEYIIGKIYLLASQEEEILITFMLSYENTTYEIKDQLEEKTLEILKTIKLTGEVTDWLQDEKKAIQVYLKNKYNEEFEIYEIEDIEEYKLLDTDGSYEKLWKNILYAHPIGEEYDWFTVRFNEDTTIIEDGYTATMIANSLSLKYNKWVEDYGLNAKITVHLETPNGIVKKHYEKGVSFEEFINSEKGAVDIIVNIYFSSNELNNQEQLLAKISNALINVPVDKWYQTINIMFVEDIKYNNFDYKQYRAWKNTISFRLQLEGGEVIAHTSIEGFSNTRDTRENVFVELKKSFKRKSSNPCPDNPLDFDYYCWHEGH